MASVEKRSLDDAVHSSKHIVLDIEGTTTSVSFVKDTLFSYVRQNIEKYIKSHWDEEEFKMVLELLKNQVDQDKKAEMEGVVDIPSDGSIDDQKAAAVKNILWQMDADRKTAALKKLQGHMWRQGYKSGELQGHLFADVAPALREWVKDGRKLYVYSSGSVEAQRLLFGHSTEGDLTELFTDFFDTEVGAKVEPDSYKTILKKLDCSADDVLFLTDMPKEANAARLAGLPVVLVEREGNEPIVGELRKEFSAVSSFLELSFDKSSKKKKISDDSNKQETKKENGHIDSEVVNGDVKNSADEAMDTDKNDVIVGEKAVEILEGKALSLDKSEVETALKTEGSEKLPEEKSGEEEKMEVDIVVKKTEVIESAKKVARVETVSPREESEKEDGNVCEKVEEKKNIKNVNEKEMDLKSDSTESKIKDIKSPTNTCVESAEGTKISMPSDEDQTKSKSKEIGSSKVNSEEEEKVVEPSELLKAVKAADTKSPTSPVESNSVSVDLEKASDGEAKTEGTKDVPNKDEKGVSEGEEKKDVPSKTEETSDICVKTDVNNVVISSIETELPQQKSKPEKEASETVSKISKDSKETHIEDASIITDKKQDIVDKNGENVKNQEKEARTVPDKPSSETEANDSIIQSKDTKKTDEASKSISSEPVDKEAEKKAEKKVEKKAEVDAVDAASEVKESREVMNGDATAKIVLKDDLDTSEAVQNGHDEASKEGISEVVNKSAPISNLETATTETELAMEA